LIDHISKTVPPDSIQCPVNAKVSPAGQDIALDRRLMDRRAGIEPLIDHVKQLGLGRSQMKSAIATLASGYRSVMTFNLSQMQRHMMGKTEKAG
jgi:hypothetical protein